jgi:alkaline phosphatase D
LYQNQPNPFRGSTNIRYFLEESCLVSLVIYNDKGQEISRLVHDHRSSGEHSAEWNASGCAPGTYIARLNIKGFSVTRKIKLIR